VTKTLTQRLALHPAQHLMIRLLDVARSRRIDPCRASCAEALSQKAACVGQIVDEQSLAMMSSEFEFEINQAGCALSRGGSVREYVNAKRQRVDRFQLSAVAIQKRFACSRGISGSSSDIELNSTRPRPRQLLALSSNQRFSPSNGPRDCARRSRPE